MIFLVDEFTDHPKVVQAGGGDAGWLYVCGLSYCNRLLTHGLIPKAQVPRLSDRKRPRQLAAGLVSARLWHEAGHDCERCPQPPEHSFIVHDYAVENEAAERKAEARSAKARHAANSRWGGSGSDASSNGGASSEHESSNAASNASLAGVGARAGGPAPAPPGPTPVVVTSSSGLSPSRGVVSIGGQELVVDDWEAARGFPTLKREAAAILTEAANRAGAAPLTPKDRARLHEPIVEWLKVGHSPERIAQAIANANVRTEPGVSLALNSLARPGHSTTRPAARDDLSGIKRALERRR